MLLRDALLENLHRAQLNPLEEAAAYGQMLSDFGCTQDELAQRIGRSRPQVSNTLRLLRLPPSGAAPGGCRRAVRWARPCAAGARRLQDQERLAARIVAEGLSVRAVEEIVALGETARAINRTKADKTAQNPALGDLAAALADDLETRVTVELGPHEGQDHDHLRVGGRPRADRWPDRPAGHAGPAGSWREASTAWAMLTAFVLGALIAFAFSLVRQPRALDATGYDAPSPADGPQAA